MEYKQVPYADIAKAEIKKQEKTMKAFIKSEREEEHWISTTKCNLMYRISELQTIFKKKSLKLSKNGTEKQWERQ